jgi:hypothetical protein
MANKGDWLPSREQDFEDLCRKWKAGLEKPEHVSAFGWKQTEVTGVLGGIDAFLAARTAYREDNSTRNRLVKDESKNAAKRVMRDFANTSIRYNKLMKDEDKLYYGIRLSGGKYTPDTEPQTFPEAEGDASVIRQLKIHFWDSASKKRGKPPGVHGAEIRWALLDQPPVSEKALINSDFDTATPFTLKFDENERGKRLYFCLRWESTTNLKGPYSEIYSAIIP